MRVYVLTSVIDYEGETVLGAFSSLDTATERAQAYAAEYAVGDGLAVYEIELDSELTVDSLVREPVWFYDTRAR